MPPSNHSIWREWIATFTYISIFSIVVDCTKIIWIHTVNIRCTECYISCVRFENGFCYLLAIVMIWTIGRMSLFDEMKILHWELDVLCDNNEQSPFDICSHTLFSVTVINVLNQIDRARINVTKPKTQNLISWQNIYLYKNIYIISEYWIQENVFLYRLDTNPLSKNVRHLGCVWWVIHRFHRSLIEHAKYTDIKKNQFYFKSQSTNSENKMSLFFLKQKWAKIHIHTHPKPIWTTSTATTTETTNSNKNNSTT